LSVSCQSAVFLCVPVFASAPNLLEALWIKLSRDQLAW
jgi:hypothetical protein